MSLFNLDLVWANIVQLCAYKRNKVKTKPCRQNELPQSDDDL